jgi:nucleoside-diphosphate-sugar epimerase
MTEQHNVGLVTGANGLVGSYVARHLRDNPEWDVMTTSRRPGPAIEGVDHVVADLNDTGVLRASDLREDTTHVFFAAYQMVEDKAEESRVNVAILANTVQALLERGAPVRHVTIYHGGKAYGAHVGKFKTPALESDPRLLFPLFYYDQEDLLQQWSRERGIHYTILRPDHICGVAFGPFVNIVHIVALYAAVTRELDQPLRFPGSDLGYHALVQFTDARIIAKASSWAANAPSARDEVFNISNGDFVRWVNTWPKVAKYFDMDLGQPFPYDLPLVMADKAPLWDSMVARYGLQPIPFAQMASWGFGNQILAAERDVISSTIKLRRAGFGDCIDSEECLFEMLDEMRAQNLIPRYGE